MLKKISIVLMCLLLAASAFSACAKKGGNEDTTGESTTEGQGLDDVANEYGFEEDEDGNTVAVVYENGKAYVIDNEGKKTGKVIKNPKNAPKDSGNSGSGNSGSGNSGSGSSQSPTTVPDRQDVTNRTDDEKATTKSVLTTLPLDKDVVPTTSASGTPVQFSDKDVTTITNMLEVPYLYIDNHYENTDRVPISTATHVACWMAQRQGIDTNTFAGGTVAVDLFCYFARTVVNFKAQCNSAENAGPITYDSSNDTFVITSNSYEAATHRVDITSIEDLGNNNYYKVTAKVTAIDSSCNKSKVVAIVQKNKLDMSLGFSVKALNWT